MIAVVVQFTEMVVRKTSRYFTVCWGFFCRLSPPTVPSRRGVAEYQSRAQFLAVSAVGFSAAVGFSLVMVLFAAIRDALLWLMSRHLFAVMPLR